MVDSTDSTIKRRDVLSSAAASTLLAAAPALARPGDGDGLNLDERPGPAAWLDEYWLVKPGKLREFVDVYQAEICALTRKIPGYRGFSIMTSMQPEQPPTGGGMFRVFGGSDELLVPHDGIRAEGEVFTGTAINYSAMMKKTFNVVVTHHLQDWQSANTFKTSLRALYAEKSEGLDLENRLVQVLYPLADNMFSAPFRLVRTGFAGNIKGNLKGKDADGLNLEPHNQARNIVVEYYDVKPDHLQEFLDVWRDNVYAALRVSPGYRGLSAVTSLPPAENEPPVVYKGRKNAPLGFSDKQFEYERGVLTAGKVQSDRSINFGHMFRNTFTVMMIHYFAPENPAGLGPARVEIFAKKHPGMVLQQMYDSTIYMHANNHWDTSFWMVATSFMPQAPGK